MKSLIKEIKLFNETGTIFGSISKSDFQNMEIVLPEKDLIKRFQAEVVSIDEKIITNSDQINSLAKLRNTLLPKLIRGEIRL